MNLATIWPGIFKIALADLKLDVSYVSVEWCQKLEWCVTAFSYFLNKNKKQHLGEKAGHYIICFLRFCIPSFNNMLINSQGNKLLYSVKTKRRSYHWRDQGTFLLLLHLHKYFVYKKCWQFLSVWAELNFSVNRSQEHVFMFHWYQKISKITPAVAITTVLSKQNKLWQMYLWSAAAGAVKVQSWKPTGSVCALFVFMWQYIWLFSWIVLAVPLCVTTWSIKHEQLLA